MFRHAIICVSSYCELNLHAQGRLAVVGTCTIASVIHTAEPQYDFIPRMVRLIS
jgi:hypothetical protein